MLQFPQPMCLYDDYDEVAVLAFPVPSSGEAAPVKVREVRNLSRHLDKKGNFNIEDMILHDYLNDDEYEFWGVYYGYYCKDCKRQINKFVVMQNYGDLDEDSIRNILLKHTNDLTVLLFDYKVACPECEGNLYTLGESSPCPRCHEGKLRLNESLMVD